MNAQRKKAAIAAYQDFQTREAFNEAIAVDTKNYTADEIAEIGDAIFSAGNQPPAVPPVEEGDKKTLNEDYEEWKVEPIAKKIIEYRKENKPFDDSCFEKAGAKPVRITRITPDKAEILNNQSENTGIRLYQL